MLENVQFLYYFHFHGLVSYQHHITNITDKDITLTACSQLRYRAYQTLV